MYRTAGVARKQVGCLPGATAPPAGTTPTAGAACGHRRCCRSSTASASGRRATRPSTCAATLPACAATHCPSTGFTRTRRSSAVCHRRLEPRTSQTSRATTANTPQRSSAIRAGLLLTRLSLASPWTACVADGCVALLDRRSLQSVGVGRINANGADGAGGADASASAATSARLRRSVAKSRWPARRCLNRNFRTERQAHIFIHH